MADKVLATTVPQDTDDQFDLQLRATRALADVHGLLIDGNSALVGGGKGATATGQIMAANATRKAFFVQNRGANPITITMGATQIDLKAAGVARDGSGGMWVDLLWKGAVSLAGTSPEYNWAEY